MSKGYHKEAFDSSPSERVRTSSGNNYLSFMSKFFQSKAKAGFTLIELLVVIAIIGVLASIVLASLNTARQKSRDARRITDIKQIQLALELYYDGTGAGQYPAASGTCDATSESATDVYGLAALSLANYIPQVPRDPTGPATTNCYKYAALTSGARTTYHLGATLSDTANNALTGDRDAAVTAAWTNDFSGLSASAEGTACSTTAGTVQPNGTETCYDVVP